MSADRRPQWNDTRTKILDAARSLFSERGYQATTTRELADAAGVAEITLFRHFPTKAQLFEKASIEPVHAYLADWIARWKDRPFGSRDVPTEGLVFFEELLALLDQEQKLLLPMLQTLTDERTASELSPETRTRMSELLDQLSDVFAAEGAQRGYASNPHITPRLLMAMTLGIATQRHWLFAGHNTPDRSTLASEMNSLAVWGLPGHPPRGTPN